MKSNFECLPKNQKYLVAVSGGIDSMVLATVLKQYNYHFEVAHINYNLRPNTNEEKQIVEKFCSDNRIKFHYLELTDKPKTNTQAWARKIRYDFFTKIVEKEKLHGVIIAHHLDDQLENTLASILGNHNNAHYLGIKAKTKIANLTIYRPILEISKAKIKEYALEHNIPYKDDPSNFENTYQRNKIRNNLANLKMLFPNYEKNLCSFLNYHNYLLNNQNHIEQINLNDSIESQLKLFCYQNNLGYRQSLLLEVTNLVNSSKEEMLIYKHKIYFVKTNKQICLYIKPFKDPSKIQNINLNWSLSSQKMQTLVRLPNGKHKKLRRFLIDMKVNQYYRYNLMVGLNENNEIVEIPFLKFKENPKEKK